MWCYVISDEHRKQSPVTKVVTMIDLYQRKQRVVGKTKFATFLEILILELNNNINLMLLNKQNKIQGHSYRIQINNYERTNCIFRY